MIYGEQYPEMYRRAVQRFGISGWSWVGGNCQLEL
jgi:hypothetical protein